MSASAAKLGPTDGKFFMVSLDNKDSFSGLNYYAEMQLGTRKTNTTSATYPYQGANEPMNVTYESGTKEE